MRNALWVAGLLKQHSIRRSGPMLQSVARDSSAPPSVANCASKSFPTNFREKSPSNSNCDWVPIVVRKAAFFRNLLRLDNAVTLAIVLKTPLMPTF